MGGMRARERALGCLAGGGGGERPEVGMVVRSDGLRLSRAVMKGNG